MEQNTFEAGVLRQVFIDFSDAFARFAVPGRETNIVFVIDSSASRFRIPCGYAWNGRVEIESQNRHPGIHRHPCPRL